MVLENLNDCPICGANDFHLTMRAVDHSVSHETFEINKCVKCGLLITNPRPKISEIGPYYDSPEYISHHDDEKGLLAQVYNIVRNYTTAQKLRLLAKFIPAGDLLDYGCGTGFFLTQAQKKGWRIQGMEPDEDARKIAEKRTGQKIAEATSDLQFQDKSLDAITLWHVLEHVHDLRSTVRWLSDHLRPNGLLFIAVPNHQSYDAKHYGPSWAAYDVPRHLYHFSAYTMRILLESAGLTLESVRPMLFDAFYVSLLSSQYSSGRRRPISAGTVGLISNVKGLLGRKSIPNTSSLIYVASKSTT